MAQPAVRSSAKKSKGRDYYKIALAFEEQVLSGRFPSGRLFRAAIERQRRDRENPPEGYRFDRDLGSKMCRRAETMPFAEGPRRGEPFQLESWQVWLLHTYFSWVDAVTGYARFRLAHLWIPKGNGKSPLAALVALCVLIAAKGGEKVYSAASTQKQARHVFDAAREMLRLAPKVAEHFGLVVEEHKIKGSGDNRLYEPVSSEAGSIEGIRPAVILLDEVHVLPNRKLYDNLRSAANKVDGSRFVTISTAGFDMSPEAIGWNLYTRTRDILTGKYNDPTLFAFIVEADRTKDDGTDADPTDYEVWKQANPNLNVSVSVAGIRSAMQTWLEVPGERPSLETKHLGWWQSSIDAFLDIRRWNALADPNLSVEDLRPGDGWRITLGIDLARTRDLTSAVVMASRAIDGDKREYRIFTRWTYLPEKSPTVSEHPAMKRWSEEGWIVLTPGETMRYTPLKNECIAIGKKFGGVEACFDEWSAAEVEADLLAGGLVPVAVRQGAKTQSEPMKELEAAVIDGRLRHDGSPVTALCIENLQRQRDRNGNIAPAKQSDHHKIDVAVAIINALVRARLGTVGEPTAPSYLESGDLMVLA